MGKPRTTDRALLLWGALLLVATAQGSVANGDPASKAKKTGKPATVLSRVAASPKSYAKTRAISARPRTAAQAEADRETDDKELYIQLRNGKKIYFPGHGKSQNSAHKKGGDQDFKDVLAHFAMLRGGKKAVDWNAFVAAKEQAMRTKPVAPGMIRDNRLSAVGPAGVGIGRAAPIGGGPSGAAAVNPTWQFTGPGGISGDPTAPWAGRIGAVAFDPLTKGTMYAGGATGGLWKSTDAGASWKPITETQPAQAISSVVVDPAASSVVYAGTGDYDGYFFNGELKVSGSFVDTGIVPGFGILRSVDGGNSWTNTDPTHAIFGAFAIRKILPDAGSIDPVRKMSRILYAVGGHYGNGGKIFKSSDFGVTWATVFTQFRIPFRNIVFNADRSALYAVADGDPNAGVQAALYRSVNSGVTWTKLNVPGLGFDTTDIAASPLNPGTIYLSDSYNERVIKTTNAAATWTTLGTPALNGEWGQAAYDHFIVCSSRTVGPANAPVTNDVLYVGLISIYQSPDAGVNWANIGQAYGTPRSIHPDQHVAAINPNDPNDLLIGNDGGVWRFTYLPRLPSNNTKFVSINHGLGVTQIHWGAAHPLDKTVLIAGAQDNGSFQANGFFGTWAEILGGDGFGAAINPMDPLNANPALRGFQNQYASSQGSNIAVTDDNWNTALAIPLNAGNQNVFFTTVWLHSVEPLFAYSGTQYDFPNNDGGYLWEYVHPALGTANTNTTWNKYGPSGGFKDLVTSFANSYLKVQVAFPKRPASPQYLLYVGTAGGAFWVSSNHGADWAEVGVSAGLPGLPITKVIASPTNPYKVWVTLGGPPGVSRFWTIDFRLDNNWRALPAVGLPDVPAYAAVQVPGYGEMKFYVGNDSGVYYTTDGGLTFFNATQPLGLPSAIVFDLAYTPSTGILTAFTYGRGSWQLDIGNNVPATINVLLQGYKGDRTKLNAQIELYRPGTNQLIEVHSSNLTAGGLFLVNFSYNGTADMRVRVPGFLSVKMNSLVTSAGTFSTTPMYAGDVNRDNSVSNVDLNMALSKLGQFRTGPEDVDGDGRVTQADISLITSNIGRVGQ